MSTRIGRICSPAISADCALSRGWRCTCYFIAALLHGLVLVVFARHGLTQGEPYANEFADSSLVVNLLGLPPTATETTQHPETLDSAEPSPVDPPPETLQALATEEPGPVVDAPPVERPPMGPPPAMDTASADRPARRAQESPAAPQASQSATPSEASISGKHVTWQSRVNQHLERHKQYPSQARNRREQGVAMVRFRVTRLGYAENVRLESSSGFFLLDREVNAALRRAQPLPKPPSQLADDALELAWRVEFLIR